MYNFDLSLNSFPPFSLGTYFIPKEKKENKEMNSTYLQNEISLQRAGLVGSLRVEYDVE